MAGVAESVALAQPSRHVIALGDVQSHFVNLVRALPREDRAKKFVGGITSPRGRFDPRRRHPHDGATGEACCADASPAISPSARSTRNVAPGEIHARQSAVVRCISRS
jgi:hypothetical protein